MKKAINATMSESKWRVLKMMLMNDMIDLGLCFYKTYIDKSINMPLVRYVDPEYLIIPCSKHLDFRDVTMAAEIREMTISDIRNESDLTESQLMQIAKRYGYTNAFAWVEHQRFYTENGYYPYDHVKVVVLDGSWLTSDIKKFKSKKIEKYGTLSYKEKPFDYELRDDDKKQGAELEIKRTQYEYEGKWIVGTDFAFGYGRSDLQIRKGNSGYRKGVLSYGGVTTGVASKVERMIPDIDVINIATFKRRNAIAAIPAPPGLIFNKTSLENTEIDGQVKTPIDLYNMLLEKGILSIDTSDSHGNPISNIHSIVAPIPSVAFEQFRIYTEVIAEHRRNIQINTGLNDMADGSVDAERMLKIQGEAKLEAANNAMQPEYAMMRELMQNAYSSIMLKWQNLAQSGKLRVEYSPLNEDDVDILELSEDISDVKFGLKVSIGTTYQEKQMLLNSIMRLTESRKVNGGGGISEDAYLALYRVIQAGNIPLAQLMIAKAIKEQEKADSERKKMEVDYTIKQNEQAAIVAEQERRKTAILEIAGKSSLSWQEHLQSVELETVKADLKDGVLDNEAQRRQMDIITGGIGKIMEQYMAYSEGGAKTGSGDTMPSMQQQ